MLQERWDEISDIDLWRHNLDMWHEWDDATREIDLETL